MNFKNKKSSKGPKKAPKSFLYLYMSGPVLETIELAHGFEV